MSDNKVVDMVPAGNKAPKLNDLDALKAQNHHLALRNFNLEVQVAQTQINQRKAELDSIGNTLSAEFKKNTGATTDFDWQSLTFAKDTGPSQEKE